LILPLKTQKGELLTQRFFSRAIVRDHTCTRRANAMAANRALM
jgi:hypothetical protein